MSRRLRLTVISTLAMASLVAMVVFPAATATRPTNVSGSITSISSTVINTVTKGHKTYTTSYDVYQFSGGLSGFCNGTDTSVNGVGPNGSFAGDRGSCNFVGSIGAASGTLLLHYSSPVGFEGNASDKVGNKFSSSSGTGGLAGAQLLHGSVDTTGNYSAEAKLA